MLHNPWGEGVIVFVLAAQMSFTGQRFTLGNSLSRMIFRPVFHGPEPLAFTDVDETQASTSSGGLPRSYLLRDGTRRPRRLLTQFATLLGGICQCSVIGRHLGQHRVPPGCSRLCPEPENAPTEVRTSPGLPTEYRYLQSTRCRARNPAETGLALPFSSRHHIPWK